MRRASIPKRGGKVRYLGIPTIRDRVVQMALKLVLEPVFEAEFYPSSYGYRPGRRAQDAIAEIHHFTSKPSSYEWVIEGDIKACFDNVDHQILMGQVERRDQGPQGPGGCCDGSCGPVSWKPMVGSRRP